MRVKEEVCVYVAIVLNFGLLSLAIQKWEVAVSACGEALNPAITKLSNLVIEWVVSHNGTGSHSTNRPEEEPEQALNKVQTHVFRHVILFVTVTRDMKDGKLNSIYYSNDSVAYVH